jgi:hypothetical protein
MSFVPLQGHKINKKRFGRYFLPSVRIRTKKQQTIKRRNENKQTEETAKIDILKQRETPPWRVRSIYDYS